MDNDTPIQTPIPEDWPAGEYTIKWTTINSNFSISDNPPYVDNPSGEYTTTVSIPALPVPEILIPEWIKNNAGWWASGQISDDSFVAGLQWLITNEIMHIPETEQGAGSDSVIPGWIKNNAEWWADDLIDDRNFVTGLQWLITNGIMIIG